MSTLVAVVLSVSALVSTGADVSISLPHESKTSVVSDIFVEYGRTVDLGFPLDECFYPDEVRWDVQSSIGVKTSHVGCRTRVVFDKYGVWLIRLYKYQLGEWEYVWTIRVVVQCREVRDGGIRD